jgi:predicted Zn finger-like uncharacterized protein
MHIVCEHCKSRFRIADRKVRSGLPVSIKCPKCRNRIEVDSGAETSTAKRTGSLEGMVNEVASSAYDASDRPFDYLEAGVQSALVCEHDLAVKQKIRNALERLNYHIVEADSGRNALKFMRFHTYNLIVLNETFEASSIEANHVLQYLAQLPMGVRRDTFTVLVGHGLRTKDRMTAFHRSVNLVINPTDLDNMDKILQGDLAEHEEFYRVFKESLKTTGRA